MCKRANAGRGIRTPAPDGVDYIMAMRCAGLLFALGEVGPDQELWVSMASLHREWAWEMAEARGRGAQAVFDDIRFGREDFLNAAPGASDQARYDSIMSLYGGDANACRSLARNADFLVIGG